ncbi:MFS transporter [Phenylobacterium sp.]|uniref:MFS transporter n=1 Tax=Phenylobacterium sp. TaxID=1871053 RepID=UPI002E330A76|nr:MFS transporter [Phenylobacterium sp.]HEX2561770.1 MFS transporter [Phenylobacterium sp.]
MSSTQVAGADRLPFKTKLAFGLGSGAETIALYTVSQFAMLYYNQVLGLPGHLAGLAVSASLILDGLSDPVVGSLSDRTRSKWGRRHLYMFWAPIPIVLSFIAIFNPPDGLSQGALFAWFMLTVILLRQAMTFYHTPHLALGGELSRDYTERSKVMSYNSFFAWAGGAATSWIALSYFFVDTPEYPRGLLNPEPYAPYSLVMGAVALAVLFGSAWFTRDRIPLLPKPPPEQPGWTPFEFFKDVGKAFRNRNYVWLLVGYFFLSVMIGLRQTLHLYVNTFYWELGSEQIRWFVIGSFAGYFTAFVVAARLHGRFDKRLTMIVACILYAVIPGLPVVLGGMGILTPETPGLLAILIAIAALGYGAVSVLSISVMSALADIADQNELRFGLRQEGVLYSTRALFAKVDQAVGAFIGGLVLTIIAFPTKAKPGLVPDEIVWNLALWDGVIGGVPGLLAALFYAKYGINRQSYEATKAALAARRPTAAVAAAAVQGAEDAPEPLGGGGTPPQAPPRPAE